MDLFFIFWSILQAIFRAITPSDWHRKKRLTGKTLLITGAGGGIGGELSRQLAAKGNRLVLWDYNADALATVADECRRLGAVEVITQTVDLSVRERVYEAAHETLAAATARGDAMDVIVHSAGTVNYKFFFDTDDRDIERLINVNLMALIWIAKAFLPTMIERGDGHLVALSSMSSVIALPKTVDYTASKFGMNGFMECLHSELVVRGHNGIRLSTVCPMFTRTPFIKDVIIDERRNPVLEVNVVACEIVDAIECERELVILPSGCNMLIVLKGILPRNVFEYLTLRLCAPLG